MRKAKLFVINTTILTLTSILMQSISIYFNSFITKKIGSEGIGLFTLIMSVYSFFITISTSGLNLTVTKIVSEKMAKKEASSGLKVITECIFLSLCFGIMSSIILLLSSNFIVSVCFKDKISALPLYIICISLPFISISTAINGYFSATRKIIKTASYQLICQILNIVLANIFLRIFIDKGLEFACISLILSICISELLSFVYLVIIYKFDRKKYNEKNSSISFKKEIFRICIPIAITSYIRSGLGTLKQLLIPLRLQKFGLTQSEALSKYGIIHGMVLPVIFFPSVFVNSFASLLIPEFSSINATNNPNRIMFLTNKILKLGFIMSSCILGLFLSFGDDILLTIYNNIDATKYLLAIVPLTIIMYVDNIVDGILRGLDEQINVMKCNILDLITSTIFIYFMIPIFSVKAYIASIYLSELLNGSISIFLLIRKTKIKFKILNWIIIPVGIALISRYILFILCKFLLINTLGIKIPLYIAIFLLITFYTKVLSIKDIKI